MKLGRLVAVVASLVLAGSVVSAAPATAETDADRLGALLDGLVEKGAPGAILYRRTPEGATKVARGKADLRSGRAADASDRYRIGSTTKTMVSVVMLQLAEEGRVRLEDRVTDLLPAMKGKLDDRITVRHLLQQTSGFRRSGDGRLWERPEQYDENRFRHFEPEELVDIALGSDEPRPTPGTDWQYANTNYIVAGMVIEQITGNSIEKELRDRIFRPLGLRDTTFVDYNPFILGRHMRGYLPAEPGQAPQDTTVYSMSYAWASGAVVSTGQDVTRFMKAVLGGELLSKASLARMQDVREFGYGLGLYPVALPCGGTVWGHNGAVFGYQGTVYSTADGSQQIAVAVNSWLLDDQGQLAPTVDQAAAAAFCAK